MLLLLLCKKIPKNIYLSISRSINAKLFHISDWFATILKLANVDFVPQDIDGQDISEAVFGDDPSPRKMVVNEFSQLTTLNKESYRGAIQIEDGWKLLLNPRNIAFLDHYELYNVNDDPSEDHDLKRFHPDVFESMKLLINEVIEDLVPIDNRDQVNVDITDGQGNLATGWC